MQSNSSLDYKASMMQGGLLNQEKPFLLPPDFEPSQWDITIPCGWVKSKEHSGNARFLEMCEQQLENYEKCTSKVERSIVIHRIVLSVMAGSPSQTGFVNRDKATGRWHFIGMTRARERVGYVLRRAIADKKAKREKAKLGDTTPPTTTSSAEVSKKKKTKKTKNEATKKQEQTGIAWHVAPSKLAAKSDSSCDVAAASVAKALGIRRRKLPIGLTNNKVTSLLSSSEEDKAEQASSKRQKTLLTGSNDNNKTTTTSPQGFVLSQALAIAKPSASEMSFPGIAPSSSSALLSGASSLLGSTTAASGHRDIYLEAAIREHAAMRESAALRELALRAQAADAVLRERLALRERAAMQERLALQEETLLRERIKMHEDAAMRERLALQERLNKRAQQQDKPVAEALAAAKAKKVGESAAAAAAALTSSSLGTTPSALLTPSLGASSLYSSALLGAAAPKYALYPGLPGYPPIV